MSSYEQLHPDDNVDEVVENLIAARRRDVRREAALAFPWRDYLD